MSGRNMSNQAGIARGRTRSLSEATESNELAVARNSSSDSWIVERVSLLHKVITADIPEFD